MFLRQNGNNTEKSLVKLNVNDFPFAKMSGIGFKWLDILEKEFDKAYVDIDVILGELEVDETNAVFNVRQKLSTVASCFAQLSHKAQTIFQNSAKLEAELIHLRTELIESKSKKELLENELHNLLLQLHSSQLSQLPDSLGSSKKVDQHFKPDVNAIKKKMDAEIKQSPLRIRRSMSSDTNRAKEPELKFGRHLLEPIQSKFENTLLLMENRALRNDILALTAEVYGAKLAAKYLDKELAGRIQQLQLLGREMRGEIKDKLWSQLESEILLQRHKTVVRACRRNSSLNNNQEKCPKPSSLLIDSITNNGSSTTGHFGDIRMVIVKRKPDQGLGISITGGREHGVPILISELEPNGPAALSEQLYIGDAILFVNDLDLRNVCHKEAVTILQQQKGDCILQVQYIAADDSDNSLEEDGLNFRFFNDEVCDTNGSNGLLKNGHELMNTPTAPRTPDSHSISRLSQCSIRKSMENLKSSNLLESLVDNGNLTTTITVKNQQQQEQQHGRQTTTTTTTNDISTSLHSSNNNTTILTDNITKFTDNLANVDTSDLILLDNVTNNIIQLGEFKKVDLFSTMESNFNCSANSLISDNLSSPMQTSTDVYLDSEVLSTDMASNDSQSPKNLQTDTTKNNNNNNNNNNSSSFNYDDHKVIQLEKLQQQCQTKPELYASNESLSNPKSDQSLLNSDESSNSSPMHKLNRNYKKQKKLKKKYFGVQTLQNIFNKNAGYSDISTTASEIGDELPLHQSKPLTDISRASTSSTPPPAAPIPFQKLIETTKVTTNCSTQVDENIPMKNQNDTTTTPSNNVTINLPSKPSIGPAKKYFSLHGQNLRVSKSLRLCPNDNYNKSMMDNDQKREKLLARYVYNANCINADGVGDPDFGTPV